MTTKELREMEKRAGEKVDALKKAMLPVGTKVTRKMCGVSKYGVIVKLVCTAYKIKWNEGNEFYSYQIIHASAVGDGKEFRVA